MHTLGLYLKNNGDIDSAMHWFRESIKNGNPISYYEMGEYYDGYEWDGLIVKQMAYKYYCSYYNLYEI